MLKIHTDGSSLNKRKLGAYAYVIHDVDDILIYESCGHATQTTNNRMELTGVLEAIRYLNEIDHIGEIEIVSDSQYVIYSITKKWSKTKNTDLWKELHEQHKLFHSKGGKIKYCWVKGHAGNPHNELVDEMAGRKLKELEELIRNGLIDE